MIFCFRPLSVPDHLAPHLSLVSVGEVTQGRINQYANYAMAWGPPVQGAPLGGTNFLNI